MNKSRMYQCGVHVWGSGGTVAQGRFRRIRWVEASGVRVSVRRAPLDEQAELEALLLHAGIHTLDYEGFNTPTRFTTRVWGLRFRG